MARTAALPTPSLRPAAPDDEGFLIALFASTRPDVGAWACGEEEKAGFLLAQYRMREHSFQTRYPGAVSSVIRAAGKDAGRICVAGTPREIRILDIALLPEWRNRGIGSAVIGGILEEARGGRLPVRLMVERFSRARPLYERMGFHIVDESGTHYLMERTP